MKCGGTMPNLYMFITDLPNKYEVDILVCYYVQLIILTILKVEIHKPFM